MITNKIDKVRPDFKRNEKKQLYATVDNQQGENPESYDCLVHFL